MEFVFDSFFFTDLACVIVMLFILVYYLYLRCRQGPKHDYYHGIARPLKIRIRRAEKQFSDALLDDPVFRSAVPHLLQTNARLRRFLEAVQTVNDEVASLGSASSSEELDQYFTRVVNAINELCNLFSRPPNFLTDIVQLIAEYRREIALRMEVDSLKNTLTELQGDTPLLPFAGIDIVLAGARAEFSRMTEIHDAEARTIVEATLK
jgi:hypothetical protein